MLVNIHLSFFTPMYLVPNPLMDEIEDCAGQIGKKYYTDCNIVPVSNGKNNYAVRYNYQYPESD